MRRVLLLMPVFLFIIIFGIVAQANGGREHLPMDFNWRFAFGHASDTKKDFDNGTGSFSYLAKAGYGDGAAAANFDDRSWRKLNLPHDWAVELPFDKNGSLSHGFKAIGKNFPASSIGWYRKNFTVPTADLGRHISIAFDGVFRNSKVWVNGQYLGTHSSGYLGVEYDISAYLNYGGNNVIAVRVDAMMEEGWFYEGAGIYRHVWLNKTDELHVASNGTAVTSILDKGRATVQIAATVSNDSKETKSFSILQSVIDRNGKAIGMQQVKEISLPALKQQVVNCVVEVNQPILWSIENPYLYTLQTNILQDGKSIDTYKTTFGIRTIRFDSNEGFFLNGKHVKIMGTNNHQDHAGVGSAIPDALQDFRIRTLKSFGCNAYRCSHNPPTPELLDACDRLGMLVIDENRLMGITQTHLDDLRQLIERDYNHPSIISWSIGNEEWGIENSITGARIAATMQAFVHSLDSTRPATAAFSGGIGSNGITTVMDLIGINYIANKSTDEQHRLFPKQSIWGTEEGSTNATRGAYFRDDEKHIIPAYDKPPNNFFISIEDGWKHYASRAYLAGMFIWTGFDYRGEPTPYSWPSIASYFGMVDLCGFPKDDAWYLKSWWTKDTILHILPHWNWKDKEGQPVEVWAYSNCDAVELFLNKKSLGKQTMQPNSHLEWNVNYTPGTLEAIGYNNGKKIAYDKVQTTGNAATIHATSNRYHIKADNTDLAILTVDAKDLNGLHVPTANEEISFSISGPGKIIGAGNGDPVSLEQDKFIETIREIKIEALWEKAADAVNVAVDTAYDHTAAGWKPAFTDERTAAFAQKNKAVLYNGVFTLPELKNNETVTFFYDSLGTAQSVYVNGKPIMQNEKSIRRDGYVLDASVLLAGNNNIVIVATPFVKEHSWSSINTNPGLIQIVTPAPAYKRKLFNGLAQVIVQSTGAAGKIVLTATSTNLKAASVTIEAVKPTAIVSVD